MVEVFKTNVRQRKVADRIVARLHKEFKHYQANFDLSDVDRILRIASTGAIVDVPGVIRLVKEAGFEANVLPDTPSTRPTRQMWRPANKRLHSAF